MHLEFSVQNSASGMGLPPSQHMVPILEDLGNELIVTCNIRTITISTTLLKPTVMFVAGPKEEPACRPPFQTHTCQCKNPLYT